MCTHVYIWQSWLVYPSKPDQVVIEATDYSLLLDHFVVASFPPVQIYLQSTMHSDEPKGTLYINLIVSVTVIGQIDPYTKTARTK